MSVRKTWAAFRRAERGTSLLEFALGLPIILGLAGYGVELSNFALVSQRVNQAALQLADNASRVGTTASGGTSGLTVFQLREIDMNDVLQGARLIGTGINLTTNGRITVSSLENIQQDYDSAPVQRIHWQRCLGARSGADYESHYGTTQTADGTDASQGHAGTDTPNGMGDPGAQVKAPPGTGVMFVEVNYEYQPLFGSIFLGQAFMNKTLIHYTASFIVRDNRDFSQMYNPSPTATPSTCDKYNA